MNVQDLREHCYHCIGEKLNNTLEKAFTLEAAASVLDTYVKDGHIKRYENLRLDNVRLIKRRPFGFLLADLFDDKYAYTFMRSTPRKKSDYSFHMSCTDIKTNKLLLQGTWHTDKLK